MTELQKRHNNEFAKLMVRMNSLQDDTPTTQSTTATAPTTTTTTATATATATTAAISENSLPSTNNTQQPQQQDLADNAVSQQQQQQQKRRDESAPSSMTSISSIISDTGRRSLSRHGSQELLDYQPSTTTKEGVTKKDGGGNSADASKKIDLEEMYKQQLDLMGVKSDSKAVKPESKVMKPSLNELKMKKQAEQLNIKATTATTATTLATTSDPVVTTNVTTSTAVSGNRTPTPQRKSSVPVMPSQQQNDPSHDNHYQHHHPTLFMNSLTGLNLSQLLHNYEVRERRNKSRTAPVQTTTFMAAVADIEKATQQGTQQGLQSSNHQHNTTHYHTIGAGEPHLIWTHNTGQIATSSCAANINRLGNNISSSQYDATITQPQQFYKQLFQQGETTYASAVSSTNCGHVDSQNASQFPASGNNHLQQQHQQQTIVQQQQIHQQKNLQQQQKQQMYHNHQQQQQQHLGMSTSWPNPHGMSMFESRSNSMTSLDSIPTAMTPPPSNVTSAGSQVQQSASSNNQQQQMTSSMSNSTSSGSLAGS